MAEIATSQSPLSAQQILARLASIPAPMLAPPISASTPPGVAVVQAQTIQALRIAQGWSAQPGAILAQFTLSC